MKMFQCRAVMPLLAHERTHVVRTYLVVAADWEQARARVQGERPGAEFVTIPVEAPDVLLTALDSMDEREAADLRSACEWREKQVLGLAEPGPDAGPRSADPQD
jgi:hypothetical protein